MKIQSFRGADLRLSQTHTGWLMCPCTWTIESPTWILLFHRLFLSAGTVIILYLTSSGEKACQGPFGIPREGGCV